MIDPVSLLIGGALVGVGTLVRRRTPKAPRPPELVCSCKHGYGAHEGGARCHGHQKQDRYDSLGEWTGVNYVPCPCHYYDGPEPLPRTWSPDEIIGGTP